MKAKIERILNAIKSEVEYVTIESDHHTNLLECLLADDIAYNTERYAQVLSEQAERLELQDYKAFAQWIIDSDYLIDNHWALSYEMGVHYCGRRETLLMLPIDEIIVHFDSYDIEKPTALQCAYITRTTDYYCTQEQISAYVGGDSHCFYMSNDTLLEVYSEYKEALKDE